MDSGDVVQEEMVRRAVVMKRVARVVMVGWDEESSQTWLLTRTNGEGD